MNRLLILITISFLSVVVISCGDTVTNNNYFVYSEGEWIQVDENPITDEEVKNDEDKIVPDEEQIIPDSPIITDSDNEVDEDYSEIPDEDEEITRDFDYPEIPDEDMCGEPCVLLYDKYDGTNWKEKDGEELMKLYIVNAGCRCEGQLILKSGYRESFYGFYFPLISETKNTLDLGSTENEIVFTTKADGKKRYFEKQ